MKTQQEQQTVRQFCGGPRSKTFATVYGVEGDEYRLGFRFTPSSAYAGHCSIVIRQRGKRREETLVRFIDYERETVDAALYRAALNLVDGARIVTD